MLLAVIIGALLGYFIGNRRVRKLRRQLQRDFNQQSLQLLETNTALTKLAKRRDQFDRKDRVLKLTMQRLSSVTALTNKIKQHNQTQKRKHFIELSKLKLATAEARQQAQRAARVATNATEQLMKLEAHYPQTNQDLMQLSSLSSSNEGHLFSANSLQSIAGITAEVERTLNAVGIHHIEQLATISDRELIGLPIPINEPQSVATRANWKSGAKEWMDRQSNG